MKIILLFLATAISSAMAGGGRGWVSSGGEIFKDSRNPWFLQNTESVRYCLVRDAKTFSSDLEKVRKDFQRAIRFWKEKFSVVINPDMVQKTGFSLATQQWIEITCDGSEDLKLQLGAGTLNAQQREYYEGAPSFVASTVRTDYSKELLRAKGFIYVASDVGEIGAGAKKWRPNVWSEPDALALVLAHEMGHVLGLRHSIHKWISTEVFSFRPPEVSIHYNLMSEEFPDQLVLAVNQDKIGTIKSLLAPVFFTIPKKIVIEVDKISPSLREALQIDPSLEKLRCILFDKNQREDRKSDDFFGIVEAYSERDSSHQQKVAEIFSDSETVKAHEMEVLIDLYLTDEQRVFPQDLANWIMLHGLLLGPTSMAFDFFGFLIPSSAQAKVPVSIGFRKSHFALISLQNGAFVDLIQQPLYWTF